MQRAYPNLVNDDNFLSLCDDYEITRVFDDWEDLRKNIFQEGGHDEVIPVVSNQVHRSPNTRAQPIALN